MKNKKLKLLAITILVITMSLYVNTANAVSINAKKSISVGEQITVTLDFETYIAAYDSLEVTYNSRIMKYNSDYSLIEGLWWDNSAESKGINKKVYSFTGTGNGTCTINIKINGLVSANEKMDNLGDINISKSIKVGNGPKLGDLDGNEIINANDASIILDLYKYGNITNDDLEVSDLDGNGVINANDAAVAIDLYKYGN